MEQLSIIGTVTLINLLALMSPGPDLVIAIRNSMLYSRKIGIWTAIGFGIGISCHIVFSLLGIAWLIKKSLVLFTCIKVIGALYLIYIGYKSFISTSKTDIENINSSKRDVTAWWAFKSGFITNVFNPKAMLFIMSIFTLVITPEVSWSTKTIIGMIMVASTILWFSLIAYLFNISKIKSWFMKQEKVINKIFGSLLIAVGLKILITKN